MIYLDTHVVVWLFAGDLRRFPKKALDRMEKNRLLISPIVPLELKYLQEIERITVEAAVLVQTLVRDIGLEICDLPFERVALEGMLQTWTRDPFDRLIIAQAKLRNADLLSKDSLLRKHYSRVIWK
jgi:PIN domain nuclease of toxin-antitoxin system